MEINQLINRNTRDSLDINTPENNTLLSDSIINDYVPFFSAFNATFKRVGHKRFSMYAMPNVLSPSLRVDSTNKTVAFVRSISFCLTPVNYVRSGVSYKVMKQCIFTQEGEGDPELLYCLAIKSSYLFGDTQPDFDNLDYSQFVMLISRKFETPANRLMYNFVKKEVITPLTEVGIDLVVTDSVNKWCFKSPIEPLEFTTLSEMRTYLKEFNRQTLHGITGRTEPTAIAESEPRENTEEDSNRSERESLDEHHQALGRAEEDTTEALGRVRAALEAAAIAIQASGNSTDGLHAQATRVREYPASPSESFGVTGIEVQRNGDVQFRDGSGNLLWSPIPNPTSATPTGETADLLRELNYIAGIDPINTNLSGAGTTASGGVLQATDEGEQPDDDAIEEPIPLPDPEEDEQQWSEEYISAHIDSILEREGSADEDEEGVQEQELLQATMQEEWDLGPNDGNRSRASVASRLGEERITSFFYPSHTTEAT